MFGHRREGDRDKGGLGSLAVHRCSLRFHICDLPARCLEWMRFPCWAISEHSGWPAVGIILVREVFLDNLTVQHWPLLNLGWKQQLLRVAEGALGGVWLSECCLHLKHELGLQGSQSPIGVAALTWVMGHIDVGSKIWSLSSPPSHKVDNSHLRWNWRKKWRWELSESDQGNVKYEGSEIY